MSGFASSLGSTADAIESFAKDSLGFIDALSQILEVLDNLGILDQLVEAFFQSFEAKQRQNNPYSQGSALYDDFRYSWYAGYVVGFVAKAVLGASAAKLAKSTKYVKRIQDVFGKSKVGRIYRSVNAPIDRGKARVGAKLVAGADRASAPMLAKARSAGATYRLWRLQGDVDSCSVGFRIQSGGCGDVFEGLDDGEAAAVGRLLERDPEAGGYLQQLSRGERKRLAAFSDAMGADGADLLAQMDDDAVPKLIRFNKGRSDDLRGELVGSYSRGELSGHQISDFSRDLAEIQDVDGIDEPVKRIAGANGDIGNINGAMYEVKVAAKYGSDDIEAVGVEYGPHGVDGEIDIKLKNGDYIEVKNKNQLTYDEIEGMQRNVDAIQKHESLDGQKIILVAREPPTPGTSLYNQLTEGIERYAYDEYGITVDVVIKNGPDNY